MKRTAQIALLALTLAAPLAAAAPALADNVGISINPGGIAFGYSDGYWDRSHAWHAWNNRADADWYHSHYAAHYYDSRHDAAPGAGWREERWWDRH